MKILKMLLVTGGILLIAAWLWPKRGSLGPEAIRTWISQFGMAAPLVYVALYAANTVILFPPIGVVSLSAGLAFGPVVGFIGIMAGAMAGSLLTFLISRRLGRRFVERRLKGRFKRLDEALATKGLATVLFFRVIPLVPYEVMNYAPGLSRIKFRDYWLGTFLGLIPGAAVAAFFGDSLARPFSPKFIAATAAMAVVLVVPAVYLKFGRRPKDGTD